MAEIAHASSKPAMSISSIHGARRVDRCADIPVIPEDLERLAELRVDFAIEILAKAYLDQPDWGWMTIHDCSGAPHDAVLDEVDRLSIVAGQLVNAQKTGKPLAPSVLAYYEEQPETLSHQGRTCAM